jgi:hypothetical protein
MDPRVITDVDDCSQLVAGGISIRALLRPELTQAEQLLDSKQEPGAADPTDQHCDLHTARQYRPGDAAVAGDSGPISMTREGPFLAVVTDTPRADDNRNAEI